MQAHVKDLKLNFMLTNYKSYLSNKKYFLMCNPASTENAYISRFLIDYSNNTGFIIIIIEDKIVCFNLLNVASYLCKAKIRVYLLLKNC